MSNAGIVREISDGWLHLDRLPLNENERVDGWCVFQLSHMIENRHPLVCVDPEGTKHLLIPINRGNRPESNQRSPLTVSYARYRFGAESSGDYLDIHCRLPELDSQFQQVVVDVVESVLDAPEPVRAVALVVARWRKLLGTLLTSGVLPYQQRISLFAELSIYEIFLDVTDVPITPAMWVGPDRAPHDFEFKMNSVEVKAIGADSVDITIHGFDQLARKNGKNLWLAILQVDESANGRSLPDLAQSILDRTPPHDRGELETRLRRAGIQFSSAPADSPMFSVTRAFHVPVDNEIPRITPEQLVSGKPIGINRLEYTIALSILKSHPDSRDGFPRLASGE
ncbi:PD-(D/E)XK motif protein [Rhodococcus sp. NPDC056506]|uniref:PD-(D/E)XK motif protein n=1 Tax=Rhodococcus sp. NPDC056506 TaxID=3345844 RepID=UPI00366AA4C9